MPRSNDFQRIKCFYRNFQDELGNTALHYHVTAKGAFAVEACLKLLQAGADFRLKNKNGQEPLELLESNEKLSTKQLDQVKCEIWARMDRKEQTQELQKSLEDVEGFRQKISENLNCIFKLKIRNQNRSRQNVGHPFSMTCLKRFSKTLLKSSTMSR